MCIARKTLNVHSSMAARALQSLGVRQLHVGQYGCKMHQDPLAGLQTRLCSLAFPAFGMAHPEDPGGTLEVRASGSGMALMFVRSLLSKFSIRCRLMRWRRRWRRWKCWLEQLHLCANSWEALRSGVGAFKRGGWRSAPGRFLAPSGAHSSSSPSGSFWWQPPRVCAYNSAQ